MILGQFVETFKHEIDLFSKSSNKASLVTATRVGLGDLYFWYAPKGFFAACKTVKSYTDQCVKEALQHNDTKASNKYAFINNLYGEHHQDTSPVQDQVANVLIASQDPRAATMPSVLSLLVRYPDVLIKFRREIHCVLGQDKDVTGAYLQCMPYLRNILKESKWSIVEHSDYVPEYQPTRLSVSVQLLFHEAAAEMAFLLPCFERECISHIQFTKCNGVKICTEVMLEPSDRNNRKVPELADIQWTYLPFNGGLRVCLGSRS